MADYQSVFCLFCRVGKEKSVVEYIRLCDCGKAVFPLKVHRMRDKATGRWQEERAPLLPGYVFLYTSQPLRRDRLQSIPDVIRVLGYGSEANRELTGRDLAFAAWVWQMDGNIEKLKVIEVGDRIRIADQAFSELRGIITRVDRRKQTCQVQLDTQGAFKYIWLPYDVVEREKTP